jgi:Family of unknown function (DUF6445)
MLLDLHPDLHVQKLRIGREQAPLLVIDNFVSDPERLVRRATAVSFNVPSPYFPGIRARTFPSYERLFSQHLRQVLLEYFELDGSSFQFSLCHYSLVTTPASELEVLQRIPHFDSPERSGLASIHYLFKRDLGGTAFYRHRQTGFEYVDVSRQESYFKTLRSESNGPDSPAQEYINGDTPLFEQIAKQDGLFNRMLVYRRNSLHSGCIARDFIPDANPLTGRLSINSFFDPVR